MEEEKKATLEFSTLGTQEGTERCLTCVKVAQCGFNMLRWKATVCSVLMQCCVIM